MWLFNCILTETVPPFFINDSQLVVSQSSKTLFSFLCHCLFSAPLLRHFQNCLLILVTYLFGASGTVKTSGIYRKHPATGITDKTFGIFFRKVWSYGTRNQHQNLSQKEGGRPCHPIAQKHGRSLCTGKSSLSSIRHQSTEPMSDAPSSERLNRRFMRFSANMCQIGLEK